MSPGRVKPFPALMLNSTVTFLLGYWVVWLCYVAATVWVANGSGIPVMLSFEGLTFPISDYSPRWNADSIRLIFIIGPGISLLLGLTFASSMRSLPERMPLLRDLFFWMAFHGINLALGSVIAGVLTSSGFAWFAKWVYLNETARFFIALLALFLLGAAGVALLRPGLRSAPSLWYLLPDNRFPFLFSRFLLPWALGAVLLALVRLPSVPLHDLILLVTPGVILGGIYSSHASCNAEDLEPHFLAGEKAEDVVDARQRAYETPAGAHLGWGPMIVVILIMILYRMALSGGLTFG